MQRCVSQDVAIRLGARKWTSGGQFHGLLIIKDHVSQPWAASGARERRLSLQDHHTRGWRCCGYSGKACSKVPDGPVDTRCNTGIAIWQTETDGPRMLVAATMLFTQIDKPVLAVDSRAGTGP